MKSSEKIWIFIGALLILVGGVIFMGVMSVLNWNFTKLSTVEYVTEYYEADAEFTDISIISDTADIEIEKSGDVAGVSLYRMEKVGYTIEINEGVLSVHLSDDRLWYEKIGIGFENQRIKISLPEGEYGDLYIKENTGDIKIESGIYFENMDVSLSTGDVDLGASAYGNIKIKTDTGDIKAEEINADVVELQVSTGMCELSGVRCRSFTSSGNTGDIKLQNIIASGTVKIERTTGDIKFEDLEGADITLRTNTGDVKGTLLTGKIFSASTSTGSVKVPESSEGGKCNITTTTGDIKVTLAK